MILLDPVQEMLAGVLRSAVAGPDGDRVRARIWDTPGPRWFTPGDPLWQVHSDASMFIGGIASLLLQSLHPAAMAGVAEHSGYRSDPWDRLQRTSHYIATTSFATIEHAEAMIAAVRQIHTGITGTYDATPYAANDPHLLTWVHIAETWCFLAAHDAYGQHRLTNEQRDIYVEQSTRSAMLLGARELPTTTEQLDAALQRYRLELDATPACMDARDFLMKETPLPVIVRPGYALLARGAIALLPNWAQADLQLTAHRSDHAGGRLATRALRWTMAAP